MSHRSPSLLRRVFPAFALTTVGVGMVHSLDRPAVIGAQGPLALLIDPNATTVVPPATNAPAATSERVTNAPAATSARVTNAPAGTSAPVTNAPAGTSAPVTNAPAGTSAPVTNAPAGTSAPATNAPTGTSAPAGTSAPVTNAPAAPAVNDCGALTGSGSPVTITWRRDYGVVQVAAKFNSDGTLCSATAQYQTYDTRSDRYESYAIPILNKQAANAGSANIQGVSGATAISDAYKKSLQSAIDNKK